MGLLVGFIIAMAVGLTGTGAGSVTAPVLMLFFGLPPAIAVGTALAFAAAIKLVAAPLYLCRRQVSKRTLVLLAVGGVPGVLAGVLVIGALDVRRYESTLFLVLGATVAIMALYNLYRSLNKASKPAGTQRLHWLPWIAAGIGAEVGFSSAGAGALGSLALLNLTTLTPAQVVGTDMMFGLLLSVIGGGFHLSAGHYNPAILWQLVAGGLPGAFIGANLSATLPARPIRVALSLWLSCLGAQLCWKAFF
jgi:uncharacterized membrane protein YfcA